MIFEKWRERRRARDEEQFQADIKKRIAEKRYSELCYRTAAERDDDENDRVARDNSHSEQVRRTAVMAINDPVRREATDAFVEVTIEHEQDRKLRIKLAKTTATTIAVMVPIVLALLFLTNFAGTR